MRAILIDPAARIVRVVSVPDFSHASVASEVFCGGDGYIRRVEIGGGILAMIDADGWRATRPAIFQLAIAPGWDDPSDPYYAGRMLLAGLGEHDEPVELPKRITPDLMSRCVSWRVWPAPGERRARPVDPPAAQPSATR